MIMEEDEFKAKCLFMAFIAMALVLVAGGIAMLCINADSPLHIYIGWGLIALGGVSTLLSVLQYKQIRRKKNETK